MLCSKCGKNNSDESNFCEYCGNRLNDNNPNTNSHALNWKAIIIGSVIGTVIGIVFILISRLYLGVIPLPFLIGIITGYIVGGGWKKGVIHATIANSIFVIISMVIFSILLFSGIGKSPAPELATLAFSVILILIGVFVLVFFLFFGVLGGILGVYIKQLLVKQKNKEEIIDKIESGRE